jgi:hypothetical protein
MHRFLIFALVLAGCASPPSTFTRPIDLYNPPAEYTYYYDALYADLFWRCVTPERGGVNIEGYAVTSLRSNMAIFNFEVRLTARDAKGNPLRLPYRRQTVYPGTTSITISCRMATETAGQPEDLIASSGSGWSWQQV